MSKELLKAIDKVEIHAGIIHDKENKGVSVTDYAIFNEFGTSTIEARPFLQTAFNENQKKYEGIIKNIYEKALDGKDIDIDINKLGELMVNDIKEKISSNIQPKNADSTIAKKGSSKTLIDTGIMRSSIEYRVVHV